VFKCCDCLRALKQEPAHKIAAIEAELAAGKGIRRIARLGRWRGHGASGLVA
jgi:hypothetical protein